MVPWRNVSVRITATSNPARGTEHGKRHKVQSMYCVRTLLYSRDTVQSYLVTEVDQPYRSQDALVKACLCPMIA